MITGPVRAVEGLTSMTSMAVEHITPDAEAAIKRLDTVTEKNSVKAKATAKK